MRRRGVLLLRAAEADVRPRDDECRARRVRLRLLDHLVDRREVVHVGDVQHLPSVALEAERGVVAEGEIGAAVDRDAIVVVEADQFPELEVAGERGCLVRDPLHQIAVAADEIRVMVDDPVALAVERRGEMRLGDRHPDRVADSLPERARRRLHAVGVAELGVSRRAASPLPELLQVLEGDVVSAQVQAAVQQHRRVAAREHEAVAIRPVRIGGIVLHVPGEERVGQRREGHRRSGMSRVRLLDRVHGEGADGVDAEQIEIGHERDDGMSFVNHNEEARLDGKSRRASQYDLVQPKLRAVRTSPGSHHRTSGWRGGTSR